MLCGEQYGAEIAAMSAHNDPSFWQWLTGGIVSMAGGLFGYHKYLDGRFSRKADKEDVTEIREELVVQGTMSPKSSTRYARTSSERRTGTNA